MRALAFLALMMADRVDPIVTCPVCNKEMPHSRLVMQHPRSCKGEPALVHPEEEDEWMQDQPSQPAADNDTAMEDAPLQPALGISAAPSPVQQLTDLERLQQSVETFVLETIPG